LYRFLAIAVLPDVETYLKSDHFVGGGSVARMTRTARPTPNFVILDESLPEVGRLVAVMLRARQAIESRSSVMKR
jgi:hypothetical protein